MWRGFGKFMGSFQVALVLQSAFAGASCVHLVLHPGSVIHRANLCVFILVLGVLIGLNTAHLVRERQEGRDVHSS